MTATTVIPNVKSCHMCHSFAQVAKKRGFKIHIVDVMKEGGMILNFSKKTAGNCTVTFGNDGEAKIVFGDSFSFKDEDFDTVSTAILDNLEKE